MLGSSMSLPFIKLLLEIIIFILAVVLHEYAHAYTAYKCGDPTPRLEGRLSLNPIKHLDPIGFLLLFVVGVGFAKPVNINPAYFYDRITCTRKVALAGPITNIVLGLLAAIINNITIMPGLVSSILEYTFYINLGLGIFNLIPLWPLDGHHILLSLYPRLGYDMPRFRRVSILLLLILFLTNLINYLIFIPIEFIRFLINKTF